MSRSEVINTTPAAPAATLSTTNAQDIDQLVKNTLESSSQTVQACIFFTAFFFIGILCKKYLKFLLWGTIITFICIKWLEYQHIITLDWKAFYYLIGIGESPDINHLFIYAFDWVKTHPINFTAGLIGFLFGYRPTSPTRPVAIKIAK